MDSSDRKAVARRLRLDDVAGIVAAAAGDKARDGALRAIGAVLTDILGATGYTMFREVFETGEVERIHSSDPKAYPVGGRKRPDDYPKGQELLARGEVFLARDRDEIREVYRDAALIEAIGVSSILNVPARFGGRTIGSINMLGVAHQFDDGAITDARLLAGLMVPVLLSWDEQREPPE